MDERTEHSPNLKRVVLRFKDRLNHPDIHMETRGKAGRKPVKDEHGKQIAWAVYADDKTITVPVENVMFIHLDLNVTPAE